MNRQPKYFALTLIIAAMGVIILFGNLTKPTHAASNNISSIISTSTNTPIEPTYAPTETILSTEEQIEIMFIVQSYIDIRYKALSMHISEDFERDIIDVTSETARVFLSEETDKLALQIKHAHLNRLRYANYKFFLEFKGITITPDAQTVTVLLSERNEVVYEISAELNPEKPIVSQSAGIEHIIVFSKEGGQWKIVSDDYNDDLWKMLRATEKSTEEILSTVKATLSTAYREENIETKSIIVPDDPSSHPYNRAGAVDYAFRHWSDDLGLYNPNYYTYPETDCQNFVSQALYEGGNITVYPLP